MRLHIVKQYHGPFLSYFERIFTQGMSDKPREERSYKVLYPGLLSSKKLNIVNPLFKEPKQCSSINEKTNKEKTKTKDLNSIEYTATQNDYTFMQNYYKHNEEFMKEYECIGINLYELVMDRILKEWRLWQIKIINMYYKSCYKKKGVVPCAICTTQKESEGNLILVCNGCNLSVHQECYGVPNLEKFTSIEEALKSFYFLDSLWFCRKCLFFKETVPKCKYCNMDGNAYKQIYNTKRWGHVLCVRFIDTLSFSNLVFLEPIEELKCEDSKPEVKKTSQPVKEVPQRTCFICNYRKGGVIKCANKTCGLYYHVTCGINALYYFDLKNHISYCHLHDPEKASNNDNFASFSDLEGGTQGNDNYVNLKHIPEIRKRIPIFIQEQTFIHKVAHLRPRFTDYIANRIICSDVCMFNDRLINNFVIEVGMFWNVRNNRYYEADDIFSLDSYNWEKWDDKRNVICVPEDKKNKKKKKMTGEEGSFKQLLTSISDIYSKESNNLELNTKIQKYFTSILGLKCSNIHIKNYGHDLNEEIRSFIIQSREIFKSLKLKEELSQELIKIKIETLNYLDSGKWKMISILQELRTHKSFGIFEDPVTEKLAPGYFKIVKNPCCFKDIDSRIPELNYLMSSFRKDIETIVNNCRKYNIGHKYLIDLSDGLERMSNELFLKYENLALSQKQIEKITESLIN